MAKLFFNQKLFHFFCQNVLSSIHSIYGILYTLYGSECREEKKKGKTWRNEVDSKNSNFRDSYLNIEKKFHYTVKDFFA